MHKCSTLKFGMYDILKFANVLDFKILKRWLAPACAYSQLSQYMYGLRESKPTSIALQGKL